jgi:hypothetical protein
MKSDKFNHLFYIEPTIEQKSEEPIDDELTEYIQRLWEFGITQFHILARGYHTNCDGTKWCGETYLFATKKELNDTLHKMCEDKSVSNTTHLDNLPYPLTHEACVHYMRWFRNAIPSVEWFKLLEFSIEYNPLNLTKEEMENIWSMIAKERVKATRRENANRIKINIKL